MIYILLTFLFLKHFVVDFLLQPPYMYKNKGTLTHPGGWVHAGLHGIVTGVVLNIVGVMSMTSIHFIPLIVIMEILIHYAMDYTKVNVCKKYGYTPTTHEQWFTWLGIDQTVHSLTYILIAAMVFL